ncbi:NADH-ubiquinone oxidoreductase chain 2 [Bienertia sinuspersici]
MQFGKMSIGILYKRKTFLAAVRRDKGMREPDRGSRRKMINRIRRTCYPLAVSSLGMRVSEEKEEKVAGCTKKRCIRIDYWKTSRSIAIDACFGASSLVYKSGSQSDMEGLDAVGVRTTQATSKKGRTRWSFAFTFRATSIAVPSVKMGVGLSSNHVYQNYQMPEEIEGYSRVEAGFFMILAEFFILYDPRRMINLFLAVSPEIFLINATFILLIHGVVFSTSKKYDYPPLVSNVGWLGLLSVARLGGQRALGCGGAIIAQLPNLMRHRVRTAGNRSMGGRLILLPPQGWLIVRSRLEDPWFWKAHESERYVECATDTTLQPATEVEHTYDDLHACIAGRKERAVDDNEKGRRKEIELTYSLWGINAPDRIELTYGRMALSGGLSLVKPKTPQDKVKLGHPHLVIGPLVHANLKKLSRTSHMQGNLHEWFWPGFPEATKKGPDTSTRGATCWFTKLRPSVTRSPGPKGSSAQLPTPPGIALSEPSQE